MLGSAGSATQTSKVIDHTDEPIKVMVVDDSAVVRGLISRMLEKSGGIDVVLTVSNGEQAVKRLRETGADVVILDIEMPVMDGLTAIPHLLEVDPNVKIIMASTLSEKNADVSLQALQAGAADYIPKPSTSREMTGGQDFQLHLIEKVKALGAEARRSEVPSSGVKKSGTSPRPNNFPSGGFTLARRPSVVPRPEILAVGSSTGGPQALFEFFTGLKGKVNVPVLLTQHMPPTFTRILAQHIERSSGIPAREAEEGDVLKPGVILVAPGDYHMVVVERDGRHVIHLNQNKPENYCRPAVDPMLRSISEIFGNKTLVVILTGMGFDGLRGSEDVIKAGGLIVAQDEETSVVWGMPGAVAEAGICSAVLPLRDLAPHVDSILNRGI